MFPSTQDLMCVAPELVLCVAGILIMVLDPFVVASGSGSHRGGRRVADVLALLGSAGSLAAIVLPATHQGTAFSGLLRIDPFSIFLHIVVCSVALLVALGAPSYLDREGLAHGEFFALVLFATVGMGVMASAQELITGFVALEVSSISSYILAGYRRDSKISDEAAMKYFLLGSFASAFFLYGIALVYGASGTTILPRVDASLMNGTFLTLGLALIF